MFLQQITDCQAGDDTPGCPVGVGDLVVEASSTSYQHTGTQGSLVVIPMLGLSAIRSPDQKTVRCHETYTNYEGGTKSQTTY